MSITESKPMQDVPRESGADWVIDYTPTFSLDFTVSTAIALDFLAMH